MTDIEIIIKDGISVGMNCFNPYSPGFSIYLVYLLDILIRSISSKLFDT